MFYIRETKKGYQKIGNARRDAYSYLRRNPKHKIVDILDEKKNIVGYVSYEQYGYKKVKGRVVAKYFSDWVTNDGIWTCHPSGAITKQR